MVVPKTPDFFSACDLLVSGIPFFFLEITWKNGFTYNKKMMIALNAPSSPLCFPHPSPRSSWGKGKKPDPPFYKKSVYRLTIWANIILSLKSEKMWCMAILGVRVMSSGHYRDEKFSFFWVWARGSPQTLTLFGVTPVFDNFGVLIIAASRRPARGL